jgi:hypothetical protein
MAMWTGLGDNAELFWAVLSHSPPLWFAVSVLQREDAVHLENEAIVVQEREDHREEEGP